MIVLISEIQFLRQRIEKIRGTLIAKSIGNMKTISPSQLSHELRLEKTAHLANRRWTLGLSLVGIAAGGLVSLYQMGILKRLPDYPSRFFDATKVDASEYGYKYLQAPDATYMMLTYAITAIIAATGGKDRARTLPVLPIALSVKTFSDILVNLYLAKEEWKYNKAFCGYCQSATLASLASFVLSLKETKDALRNKNESDENQSFQKVA